MKYLSLFIAPVIILSLCLSALAQGGAPDPRDVERDVEAAFRSALSMVAYHECWKLWEGATQQSRIAISKDEACKIFNQATSRVAVGGIEDLKVTSTSAATAVIAARLTVESKNSPRPLVLRRSFVFFFEDGGWRFHLWDYLSLVSY